MVRNADRIVVVCQWLYEALAANGVPPEKLALSRQGLLATFLTASEEARAVTPHCCGEGPLKLLCVGRWHPVKGIDIVVRAVRALPSDTRVLLTIHGLPGEPAYERRVRKIAGGDPRIVLAPPLGRGEVAAAMVRHDTLVVPSMWLETGPLVVLEAQAAGLYVMGSRLGGIAELVSEGAGGELVDAGSVRAWTEAITRLAERHAKGALACQPSEVRTMSIVAAEMAELYGSL
jgi:glycosyltransferase involved in cell wall biosynthesis